MVPVTALFGFYVVGGIIWACIHLANWMEADSPDERRIQARMALLTPIWFVSIPVVLTHLINDAKGKVKQ